MTDEAPTTIPITEEQSLTILGLTTLLIDKRGELARMEDTARKVIVELGAREGEYRAVDNAVSEATYNEGDDPQQAAESIRSWLGLEVAE